MQCILRELWQVWRTHMVLSEVAALWVGSAAISALSPPTAASSTRYQWLYRFLHLLAANLDRAGLLTETAATTLANATQTERSI